MIVGFTITRAISVYHYSNPAHGEVYSIHNVIKFFSDLQQVGGFPHDLTYILLKVALNTITLTLETRIPNHSL